VDGGTLAVPSQLRLTMAVGLGSFPKAFSHLALFEAAGRITLAERLEELA